jgi:hypothetical protein
LGQQKGGLKLGNTQMFVSRRISQRKIRGDGLWLWLIWTAVIYR